MDTTGERNIEAIKKKIRKLLALSKSSNENEAASALEKANRLMESYRLTEGQCQSYTVHTVKATKKLSLWRQLLASSVAWLYSTIAVRDEGFGSYLFYGEEFDAFMTAEMYTYLAKAVERMARQNVRRNAKTKFRNSYKFGIAENIRERIFKMGHECSWASVRKNQRDSISAYVETLHNLKPDTGKEKSDKNAIARGNSDGNQISLNRQTAGHGGRMIGGY